MGGLSVAIAALVPSIGVLLLFWLGMRSILRADRSERAAIAHMDAASAGQEKGEQ